MGSLHASVATFVLLAITACATAAGTFPTTVPARVGNHRFVRASYTKSGKQTERTVIRGLVKVTVVDEGGNEVAGTLDVEKCARFVDGVETELAAPGQRLSLVRVAGGRVEFAEEGTGAPLPEARIRHLRLVCGLRAGRDDLDFWDGDRVAEDRLRKIIATTDFDIASVRSHVEATPGDFAARLSIPRMTPTSKSSKLIDGTFAVECRWRVENGRLERFRRTRWVLHDPDERVVEIVGIESAAPDAWWAKSEDQVRAEAERLAANGNPLLGFYRLREPKTDVEKDLVTELIKVK